MILAELSPYLHRRFRFGLGDKWGAYVAHQELIRASLATNAADAVHLFLSTQNSAPLNRAGMAHAIRELRDEFSDGRVAAYHYRDLGTLAACNDYVFLHGGLPFSALSHARLHLGVTYPICCIIHAVPPPYSFQHYLLTILTHRPCDALITT